MKYPKVAFPFFQADPKLEITGKNGASFVYFGPEGIALQRGPDSAQGRELWATVLHTIPAVNVTSVVLYSGFARVPMARKHMD